ncbi:MAG: glutathione S-transferase family protein, partial [Hyphomicrobiaceae bacterium]
MHGQSGNAYKPALMLALNKADWEAKWVDFFNGGVRTPEFLAINDMGEVPVLIHGETTLTQSAVILDYLSRHFGTFSIEESGEETRREGLRWLFWDNHKLTSYIATYRFLLNFAKTGDTPVTDFFAGRIRNTLKVLNGHLHGRDWMVGDKPTIVDLSLCGYLFWPDEFRVSWDDHPAIAGWLGRIKALDGWVHPYELMPGHPLPA